MRTIYLVINKHHEVVYATSNEKAANRVKAMTIHDFGGGTIEETTFRKIANWDEVAKVASKQLRELYGNE